MSAITKADEVAAMGPMVELPSVGAIISRHNALLAGYLAMKASRDVYKAELDYLCGQASNAKLTYERQARLDGDGKDGVKDAE